MSQPRQPTPSASPTPSKSSLRRTSGVQNPSQRSLLPPPSPHFEEQPAPPVRYSPRSPPNQTLEYQSDEDEEPLIYPDIPAAGDSDSYFPDTEPDRLFQPFFTLIEDGLTSEHHHPSVHYIFADDDTEIITEAALRSLDQDDIGASSTAGDQSDKQSQFDDGTSQTESRLPAPTEGVQEHYLVLDIRPIAVVQARQQQQQNQAAAASSTQAQSQNTMSQPEFLPSYVISSFASLSADWQITSASITSAPTMGDAPTADANTEDEPLMLRIEGRGVPPWDDIDMPPGLSERAAGKTPAVATGQGTDDRDSPTFRTTGREGLEDMIERFQSRLSEIKKLIDIDMNMNIGGGVGDGAGDSGFPTGAEGVQGRILSGIGLEEQD